MDNGDARLALQASSDSRLVVPTLLGAPHCANVDNLDASVALLGVPYDFGGKAAGSRFGPDAVRDAQVYFYAGRDGQSPATGYYDVESGRQRLAGLLMADCGNVAIMAADVEGSFARITRVARAILARGSLLVVLGGDSSITAAVVRSFDAYPSLDVVHFDAHHDFDDGGETFRWSSGCAMRRCAEFSWVRNMSHVGLRSMVSSGDGLEAAMSSGHRIIGADQFRQLGAEAAMDLIPESNALYMTIDVDVMDPSICPGTGSPEPGGLTYLEMRSALRALAHRGRIVGIDLVEVNPQVDPTGITSKVAARLLIDLLTATYDDRERHVQ